MSFHKMNSIASLCPTGSKVPQPLLPCELQKYHKKDHMMQAFTAGQSTVTSCIVHTSQVSADAVSTHHEPAFQLNISPDSARNQYLMAPTISQLAQLQETMFNRQYVPLGRRVAPMSALTDASVPESALIENNASLVTTNTGQRLKTAQAKEAVEVSRSVESNPAFIASNHSLELPNMNQSSAGDQLRHQRPVNASGGVTLNKGGGCLTSGFPCKDNFCWPVDFPIFNIGQTLQRGNAQDLLLRIRPPAAPSNDPEQPRTSAPLLVTSPLLLKHTNEPVVCKFCKEEFPNQQAYTPHYEAHMRDAKPFVCHFCQKRFAHTSYLNQHMRIHLGIRPYRCAECDRTFTQLSHLNQHQRIHTGARPYVCKQEGCAKSFSQLSNLQTHARMHSQIDKPWKCKGCYKCFETERQLWLHIPKHRAAKHHRTNVCGFCGMSYTGSTQLNTHVMEKHPAGRFSYNSTPSVDK